MSFVIPNFNLQFDAWTADPQDVPTVPPAGGPRLSGQDCALVYGPRINGSSELTDGETDRVGNWMFLLLPVDSGLRGYENENGADIVEVPQGTGRFYLVRGVDLVGYGWPNEHKCAVLLAFKGSFPDYP